MAEIGIDPSWEYGQLESSSGGTKMQGKNSWIQRGLGNAGPQEWKITASSSTRAERDSGNAPEVEMQQQ